jgi:hypothetical protein
MKRIVSILGAALLSGCVGVFSSSPSLDKSDIVIETAKMKFVIGTNAVPKSLVIKSTGEEMLETRENISLFSVTQMRPFNNEIKLIHPHKQTTFQANRIRKDGDSLVIGFNIIPYEAVVDYKAKDGYVVFTLNKFNCLHDLHYEGLKMDVPPVKSFRILQLPVKNRENFGDWLNVMWDDKGALSVMAVTPMTEADNEERFGFRNLNAELHKGYELFDGKAALVVGAGEKDFLDSTDALEQDYNLPRGVQNRRSDKINSSIFWTASISPKDVDKHIAIAKKSGIKMILIYFTAFFQGGYDRMGDYDFNKNYPNKYEDVKYVIGKLNDAGITVGFHTLQTHVGSKSRYVTPVADPRLNLTRRFTLAKPISDKAEVSEIYVHENPVDSVMFESARVLKFGGELFSYTSYTTTPPYKFTGVKRGYWKTNAANLPAGTIGGILDVSEYAAISCYADQFTDLQDEVGEKIAKLWDCGFEFGYFDGSEGVNPPCNIFVPYSQYRVIKKFKNPPIFTEGAAKGHFGWHVQAGANAFDVFPPEIFKEMIVRFPQAEAPLMRKDFSRLNFGWWRLYVPGDKVSNRMVYPHKTYNTPTGTQLDMWEFGTSRAAAWDCPPTVMINLWSAQRHPRIADLLETMRRWEDVRVKKWLTPEHKQMLKSSTQEHHLYVNEKGEYELIPIFMMESPKNAKEIRAFRFNRNGKNVIALWHTTGKGKVEMSLSSKGEKKTYDVAGIQYIETDLSACDLEKNFASASLLK